MTSERTVNINHGDIALWSPTVALDTAMRIAHEGDYAPEDFDLDMIIDPQDALTCLRVAQQQLAAAKVVEAQARVRFAQLVGVGGAARIGDTVYRYSVARKERCINDEAALGMLQEQLISGDLSLVDVVTTANVKRGAIAGAVRDTFFEYEYADEPSLNPVAVDRAPKFLQGLDDGDVFMKVPA